MLTKNKVYIQAKRLCIIVSMSLLSSVSIAVAPIQTNFIMGLDVQGQRLNLYNGCPEGYVSCDDMLLVAPDLARLAFAAPAEKGLDILPYKIMLYYAKTMHSTCKDGVTPCSFQGYSFDGEDINGFISPVNHEITIYSNGTADSQTISYLETSTYLPLVSQARFIDNIYNSSDTALNSSYISTLNEVRHLYGRAMATSFKQDQIEWITNRSKDCGADDNQLPRTQAEKVCFIQKNEVRLQEYFLWLD